MLGWSTHSLNRDIYTHMANVQQGHCNEGIGIYVFIGEPPRVSVTVLPKSMEDFPCDHLLPLPTENFTAERAAKLTEDELLHGGIHVKNTPSNVSYHRDYCDCDFENLAPRIP